MSRSKVARSRVPSGASTAFATLDELSAYLVAQKASVGFSGRTDLVLAVDDQATIATLVAVLGRAHTAGFTSATWSATTTDELRALTR